MKELDMCKAVKSISGVYFQKYLRKISEYPLHRVMVDLY